MRDGAGPRPVTGVSDTRGPGSAADLPAGCAWFADDVIVAASWGSYVLSYRVGQQVLPTGATLRVQLPDSWHAWRRNGAKGVQSTVPAADNYVSARNRSGTATVRCEVEGGETDEVVKSNRRGIDGREGRYVYVIRVTVEEGTLAAGDLVEIVIGDQSSGSRGLAAALQPQGPEPVAVAIDPGDGHGQRLLPQDCSPVLEVHPGGVHEVLAYAPSLAGRGERATLRLVTVDAEGNRVAASDADLEVGVHHGGADLGPVRRTELPGCYEADFTPTRAGVLRLLVRCGQAPDVMANPSWISRDLPPHRVFWGDLHSHADHSFDGVGRFPYEYARDVACLDFYALTEHCERWADGDWEFLVEQAAKFHDPGRFVTFLAYEATFSEPWGHHNVYFRDPSDAVVLGANTGTVLDLWAVLRERRALTIPHHTGVAFSPKTGGSIPGSTSPAVDWQHHDPGLRRAVEIYSGHGQSEFYDPAFDLSYENSDFSTNTSRPGPHYARDAWERGHELGVVASSDNHRAQPGRGELGLAAVLAAHRERDDIFDALYGRRSYGTTGARMLVDADVDGIALGRRGTAGPHPTCRIRVSGTADLETVELFSGVPGRAGSVEVAASWRPDGPDFEARWRDERKPSVAGRLYYVRARQCQPYRGRKPTAWTSPIWISHTRA